MPKDVDYKDYKKVLLVEGSNDGHVAIHIWKSHHGSGSAPFEIIDKKGIGNLLKSLYLEFSTYDREVIGILIDANDNPGKRWKEIVGQLEEFPEISIPQKPEGLGTIIDNQPRIGIWMMPDNQSSGELENFIHQLIPDRDPVWPRSCDYINGIPEKDGKFSLRKKLRAQIHAWLATRERPRPMGAAIGCGDLDVQVPLANEFYEWLCRLFHEE